MVKCTGQGVLMSCHPVIGVLLCVGWAYMCTHSTYVYVCVSMTLYVRTCVHVYTQHFVGMCVYVCVWMVCGYHVHVLFMYIYIYIYMYVLLCCVVVCCFVVLCVVWCV